MASAFAHALSAYALSRILPLYKTGAKLVLLGVVGAIIPDIDVLAFSMGIPYEHVLGHRGITHSFLFALLLGIGLTFAFFRPEERTGNRTTLIVVFLSICTASHAVLDAMTTGGLGVAFFAPFNNDRYFLPWRVIKVSPIGVAKFLSERGLSVIKSEMVWVGIPSLALILIGRIGRKFFAKK